MVVGERPDARALATWFSAAGTSGARTLAILDFQSPGGEKGTLLDPGRGVESLDAVVELPGRAGEGPVRLRAGLGGVPADARERAIEVAGWRGASISAPGWPARRECAWVARGDRLVLGIGRHTMPAWLAGPEARREPAEWGTGRDAMARAAGVEPGADPVVEVFVNLNRLRVAAPGAFAVGGPLVRLLDAWGLDNARSVGLCIWEVRPGGDAGAGSDAARLEVAIGWSARSEPPGVAHAIRLTGAAGLVSGADRRAWSAVLRPDWAAWIDVALDTYVSSGSAWDAIERGTKRSTWLRRHDAALDVVVAAAADRIAVSPQGTALHARVPLRDPSPELDARLAEVFGTIDERVAFAEATGRWSVAFERLGVRLTWWRSEGAIEALLEPARSDGPADR